MVISEMWMLHRVGEPRQSWKVSLNEGQSVESRKMKVARVCRHSNRKGKLHRDRIWEIYTGFPSFIQQSTNQSMCMNEKRPSESK